MADVIPENERFLPQEATAGQTTFAYNFTAYANEDVTVFQIPIATGVVAELTVNVDYTLTNVGNLGGGNIELTVAAAENDIIIAFGSLPELRQTDYNAAGDFNKVSVNTAFNRLVMICQQLRRDADRSIRLQDWDVTDPDVTNLRIPLTEDRKGKYLYFDETTGALSVANSPSVEGPVDSENFEVALFADDTGSVLKRPGTTYMILPQGSTAQRGAPGSIVMRGNTDGSQDVEVYVNGVWRSVLTGGVGGTGAPIDATYIVQQPSGVLTSEQAMSALATGLVKNTTATGVQSIAVDGTDYFGPGTANINDIANLAVPGADRILFYDNSAGAIDYLTLGTNLSITGTTLNAAGGGGGGGITNPLTADINMNGFGLDDTNDNELVTFTETASAVNHINITNNTTGNVPIINAAGGDTNIDIALLPKGTGDVAIGNYFFDGDQLLGPGLDNYVLTFDDATSLISLEQAVRENTTQSWTAEQTFKELKLTEYNLVGTVIDPANGSVQYKTLAANTTFTESFDNGQDVLLMINDGSSRTITWPTITWLTDSGSAPTLKTTGYTPIYIFQMVGTLYGIRCGDGG